MIKQATVPATPAGYQHLRLADRQDGRRVWAVEGTGGYGAGLTRFLQRRRAPGKTNREINARYDLKLWIGSLRESATYPPA
jgi:hypothetical protein